MSDVLKMTAASRPDFTPKQVDFCDALIEMGLARLAIASLVLGVDMDQLNPTQVTSVNRLIQKRYKVLGYRIVDARHARTAFMQGAVHSAAKRLRVRVKIA